ncbi:Sec-independent protein translocase protein TatB [Pelagerythrobacter marensis]|uniref:Sec-independent protein translocase protein TatB n=1 Tax=Pelagerythrobacter marensis TaxID=543877 RepID=A0A0G3X7W2_9SPHN|nr:Sec-independent protein translocase protein TatB [Pelagerythrobacter marensis]AKM06488.1 Sec-independent protein translocase protein TatB [Pelagerythrobacter marensis]
MFDIGATELLVIAIVAIIVIGPKDMPLALRTAGRWIGKIRRVSAHFRTGIDAMVREAEMEDMEMQWRDQNARIMAQHPQQEMQPLEEGAASAESRSEPGDASEDSLKSDTNDDQPGLPLGKPPAG